MYEEVNIASQVWEIPKPLTEGNTSFYLNQTFNINAKTFNLSALSSQADHEAPVPKGKRENKSPSQKARSMKSKQERKIDNTNIF